MPASIAGRIMPAMSPLQFFALVLVVLTTLSHAQVYKCTGPGGQVTYADAPCGAGARTLSREALESNTLDASGLRERARAEREAPAPVPAATAMSSGGGICPDPLEIRNLETSASSSQLQDREREFLWAELRRARACTREGGRYTADDWRALREAQAAQTAGDPVVREAARRRAEGIHASAASAQEQQRMLVDRQVEAQRESGGGTTVILRRPPRPVVQPEMDCRGTVCTDGRGARYDRQPDGSLMRRQDQASCTEVRGQLRCSGGFNR